MDELLGDFIAETREMLQASAGEIVAWEADPSDGARLDTIFRFVHTVKGNCGFFDFPRLERLSHAAEDALADCRAGRRQPDQALVSAVLAIIDRIGEMTDAIEEGGDLGGSGDEALIAALAVDDPAPAEPADPAPCSAPVAAKGDPKPIRASQSQRSIRLPVNLLDEVMKGVSDMVLARNDLARRLREGDDNGEIEGPFDRLSGILAHVRDAITRMRMQRLEHLFGTLPRLVRDLSHELGKQVVVEFEGGDVEIDREMVEVIRDPLTHIIRNAVDHGIEAPADRLAAGKRGTGLLRFEARQAGNQITLAVVDDGRGIDGGRLAEKAVAAGIHTQAEVDAMSDRHRLRLVFSPGLSTAETISAVSGRGVGMDVVRANIEKVGGSIDVTSTPGKGTSFHLRLPLTLSIISALTVGSGGCKYALPRSFVEEIVFGRGSGVEFAEVGDRRVVTFRDRRVPCLSLAEVLGTDRAEHIPWRDQTLILVRLNTTDFFALAVDQVFDHEDIVVKPIAPAVMLTGIYSGTTLLDDGCPIMLLDIAGIAAAHGLAGEGARAVSHLEEPEPGPAEPATQVMLFRGLDQRRRAIRLELVRRIDTIDRAVIEIEDGRAQAVIDGALIPVAGQEYGPLPEDRCRMLRLSDGVREIAYAVADVLDTVDMSGDVAPAGDDGAIEGTAIIDDRAVPVVDGHRLFAVHGSAGRRAGSAPLCRLPQDSEWVRTILGPLVASAGYRVTFDPGEAAQVAILLDDSDEAALAGETAQVIRLSSQEPPARPDSIYRYDRQALIAALDRCRAGEGG